MTRQAVCVLCGAALCVCTAAAKQIVESEETNPIVSATGPPAQRTHYTVPKTTTTIAVTTTDVVVPITVPPSPPTSAAKVNGGALLERIAQCESGGDYKAENPTSTASGKWQVIDSTWGGYGGYHHASDAPAHVQNAHAKALYASQGTTPWNPSRHCWAA